MQVIPSALAVSVANPSHQEEMVLFDPFCLQVGTAVLVYPLEMVQFGSYCFEFRITNHMHPKASQQVFPFCLAVREADHFLCPKEMVPINPIVHNGINPILQVGMGGKAHYYPSVIMQVNCMLNGMDHFILRAAIP